MREWVGFQGSAGLGMGEEGVGKHVLVLEGKGAEAEALVTRKGPEVGY